MSLKTAPVVQPNKKTEFICNYKRTHVEIGYVTDGFSLFVGMQKPNVGDVRTAIALGGTGGEGGSNQRIIVRCREVKQEATTVAAVHRAARGGSILGLAAIGIRGLLLLRSRQLDLIAAWLSFGSSSNCVASGSLLVPRRRGDGFLGGRSRGADHADRWKRTKAAAAV